MGYKIKEIFKSYQGEGYNAGTVAVFVRFAQCNLWSGSEIDRKSSICQFCDTNFLGGVEYETAGEVCDLVDRAWVGGDENRVVILTGGEPLIGADVFLTSELKKRGSKTGRESVFGLGNGIAQGRYSDAHHAR